MDLFKKSNTVRLRSRHGKYLCADDDECMVSQSRNGSKANAVWTVELDDDDASAVKLKSCYDCYLTAANAPFLLGMTGKKVLQTKLVDSESSVIWKPIREGSFVKLRTQTGNYLRANGSIPPWRNSVTHDTPQSSATQNWVLWEVNSVGNEFTNGGGFSHNTSFSSNVGEISHNTSFSTNVGGFSQNTSFSSNDSFKQHSLSLKPTLVNERIIHYTVADDDTEIPDDFELELVFKGHDLKMLTEKLKEEIGIEDDLYVCAKNHVSNKLYPLLLQLPPNNLPMYLVVVKASSKLAGTLPGVGSESEQDVGKAYSHSSLNDESNQCQAR